MTIFMITHDLQESFKLGTRLLVFDRVRHDPQEPDRYGARVTYDIPLRGPLAKHQPGRVQEIAPSLQKIKNAADFSSPGVPAAPPA